MRLFTLATAACLAALVSTALFAQAPRRDGNWEVTITMEMPNMPNGMSMPPIKTTQCVTPAEAADPQKALPQRPAGRGGNPDDCTVSDYKTEGSKVSWSMKCEGSTKMDGTGEITYSGDSYTGVMKMNMDRGGQPMSMTMNYSGKRLGDCTK
jgi:hypothetical protein